MFYCSLGILTWKYTQLNSAETARLSHPKWFLPYVNILIIPGQESYIFLIHFTNINIKELWQAIIDKKISVFRAIITCSPLKSTHFSEVYVVCSVSKYKQSNGSAWRHVPNREICLLLYCYSCHKFLHWFIALLILPPWRWGDIFPLQLTFSRLHSFVILKIELFITTGVRILSPTNFRYFWFHSRLVSIYDRRGLVHDKTSINFGQI